MHIGVHCKFCVCVTEHVRCGFNVHSLFKDKVAKLCRKSWKRILDTPALSYTCVLFFGNKINFFIPAVKRSKWTPADLRTGYD